MEATTIQLAFLKKGLTQCSQKNHTLLYIYKVQHGTGPSLTGPGQPPPRQTLNVPLVPKAFVEQLFAGPHVE